MCGICGIVRLDEQSVEREEIERMVAVLHHRGPDGRSTWLGDGVGLGHTRLSIIDLEHGAQPMANEDDTVFVTFNGEIYNHHGIRERLASRHLFRTRADTEVLVHLYEERGAELVDELAGFFAFALWDVQRRRLVLARDRLGKKPLFFALEADRLVFASEPRAILRVLAARPEPDPVALDEVLALRYVAGTRSGYRGIEKLLPGESLVLEGGRATRRRFWNPPAPEPHPATLDEAVEDFRPRFDRAVASRLEADVPLGLLLSGGLDSTAVLEAMSRVSPDPVHTFTVAFTREKDSEAAFAGAAARHFGSRHREFTLGEADLLEHVEEVLTHLDEPFGDPSILPTVLVCRMAREEVTVCLGGDGGDELFGGYTRYVRALSAADRAPVRGLRARLFRRAVEGLPTLRPKVWRLARNLADRLTTAEGRYAASLVSIEAPLREALHGPRMREAIGASGIEARLADALSGAGDLTGRMLAHDLGNYLPGFVLTKVDRASMFCSLEMRAPFLDHELVEWAATLGTEHKIARGERKILLRRALDGRVPPGLLARGKKGFGTPLGRWFRHELAALAEEHLRQSRLAADGWLDGETLGAVLDAHAARRRNLGEALWTLLALEVWYRRCVLASA